MSLLVSLLGFLSGALISLLLSVVFFPRVKAIICFFEGGHQWEESEVLTLKLVYSEGDVIMDVDESCVENKMVCDVCNAVKGEDGIQYRY